MFAVSEPTASPRSARSARSVRPVVSVVCAVERGLASLDAARQAAALAGDGRLQLVAVRQPFRVNHGDPYLSAARFVALREGSAPQLSRLDGPHAVAELLVLAGESDLLVVGDCAEDGGWSRVARAAVHRAGASVLIARRLPHGAALTDRIVVATDDADEDCTALQTACALAERDWTHVAGRLPSGDADSIVDAARGFDATLVVVAGQAGPLRSAAGRVAARVAEGAHCSVLIVRRPLWMPPPPRRARAAAGRVPDTVPPAWIPGDLSGAGF